MADNQEEGRGEPEALSRDQIDYAFELIDEIHPIEKYPIYDAFPYLKWVSSKCCHGMAFCVPYDPHAGQNQVQEQDQEQQLLSGGQSSIKRTTYMCNGKEIKKRSKKPRKQNLNKEKTKGDPISTLGFGIVAYIGMLYYMIWAFTLYSLILLPTMMFYGDGKAYAGAEDQSKLGFATHTIGAMGYSSYQCLSIPREIGTLTLNCEFGVIGVVDHYGINPPNARDSCMDNDRNKLCKPDPVFADVFADATGKKKFSVAIEKSNLWPTTGVPSEPSCTDGEEFFYVQYTCIQKEGDLHTKYVQMATTVFLCCVIAYLFTISLRQLYQGGKLQQIEWDMATVTAGDYAVELKINPSHYRTWYDHEYRKSGGDFENDIAPALSLTRHLTKEIEEELTVQLQRSPLQQAANGPNLVRKSTKKGSTDVQIADICFSFNNQKLIHALRKRGSLIASQDFDKMREQDEVVNELFQDFDSMTVPVSAFIVFVEEDIKTLALENTSSKVILGQSLKFNEASEPTDIIWENRHFTKWDYIKRQVFAFIIILILLFGSFILVFIVASYSQKIANTYPQVNCKTIEADYRDSQTLMKYAVEDYDYIETNAGKKSSGTLQCFCLQESDRIGKSEAKATKYPDDSGEQICDKYFTQVFYNFLLANGLSYVLTIINFILRTICIALIDWVGFATETERLSKTTTITFVVQFFNTAFLLLLVSANLSEQPITFWLNGGQFSDFNDMWFRSIGNTLVGTMQFNAFFPLIEALGYFCLRLFFRILDHGCSCDKYKTKKTSIQSYIDTYTGPVYLMHYKYAALLNIVFVTFMYGLGMPILFPIAILSFIILYLQEKMMLYYGYRVPPMYDERLSQTVLDQLRWAPILLMLFGYWMASNQQLISNDHLVPRATSDDLIESTHTMGTVFSNRGWEGFNWTMLLGLLVLLIIIFFGKWIVKKIEQYFPKFAIGDIEINEDIDSYWASLDDEDRKWSQREEENARDALGLPMLTDAQYRALRDTPQTAGKTLQGTHSYDILANPLYLDDFQYVTAAEDDRNDMIIDDDADEGNDAAQSDFVRVALNLAYLTEKQARNFKFDKTQMQFLRSLTIKNKSESAIGANHENKLI